MSKKYLSAWGLIALTVILFSIFQLTQASRRSSLNLNNNCGPLSQEAEHGQLFGSMQIGQDSNASGSQYVFTPSEVERADSINNNLNKVQFCIQIPEDGQYQIQTWVRGRSSHNNSMFVAVNDLPSAGYLWDTEVADRFVEDFVSDRDISDPQIIDLTAGSHTLTFANREAGTMLDRFSLIRVGNLANPTPAPINEPTAEPITQPISSPIDISQCRGLCVFLPMTFVEGNGFNPSSAEPVEPTPVNPTPVDDPIPVEPTAVNPGNGGGAPIDVTPTSTPLTPVATSIPVSPEPTPTAMPATSCGELSQEAENGQMFGGMQAISDGTVTVVIGSDIEHAQLNIGERVEYCFTINQAGEYWLTANVKAPSFASNSMFWSIEGASDSGMVWHMNVSDQYTTQFVSEGGNPEGGNSGRSIYLEAGDHTLSFYHREAGVMLDRFEIVKEGDAESGEGAEIEDPIEFNPGDSELNDYDFPLIDYSNAGLTGGIPNYPNEIRVTGYSQSDIEKAIANAQPFTRIILPAGTYNIGTINISKSNIALVGEGNGCGETVLKIGSADTGINVDGGGYIGSSINLTADANRNSHTIQVSNSGGFNIGDYVMIRQDDDGELFRADLSRNPNETYVQNNATQINKIVAKNGNTLTLEGGLNLDYKIALNAEVAKMSNMISGVGIENLTLERTVDDSAIIASGNIYFEYVANSWIRGVHSKNSVRAHIFFNRSYKGEIRGNYLDKSYNNGPGGHGYGVRLQGGSTDFLVENNTAKLLRHSYIAQIGANGNVFGYNYSADPYGEGFGEIYTDLSVHGGFGHSNLFEGNQAQHAKIDNIHASNSWNLFFRNRLEKDIDNYTYKNELLSKGATTPHIWVHENQYYNTFLANEMGFPGANPATQTVGFTDGRTRDNLTVCKFTNSSDDERGCGRTRETTLIHGTHDFLTGQTSWDSSLGQTSFPASAYLSEKPSFWGSSAWPTFGPDTLNQSEANKIVPAKTRFLAAQQGNGSFCYIEG